MTPKDYEKFLNDAIKSHVEPKWKICVGEDVIASGDSVEVIFHGYRIVNGVVIGKDKT